MTRFGGVQYKLWLVIPSHQLTPRFRDATEWLDISFKAPFHQLLASIVIAPFEISGKA